MWAKSLGAPTWLARSIIAIELMRLPCAALAEPAGLERIWQTAAQRGLTPPPPLSVLRAKCGEDALCAARLIAAGDERARLRRVVHPDTDSIRRVTVLPSVTAVGRTASGVWRIRLDRFGRKVVEELQAALRGARVAVLEIDLRRNGGGDIGRMLRAAALFTGPVQRAVRLKGRGGVRWLAVPRPAMRIRTGRLRLLAGARTASSAEVFAALLKTHAEARLIGAPTHGKNWLLEAVPVTHDWRLLLPAAVISVPGVELANGLTPDAAAR